MPRVVRLGLRDRGERKAKGIVSSSMQVIQSTRAIVARKVGEKTALRLEIAPRENCSEALQGQQLQGSSVVLHLDPFRGDLLGRKRLAVNEVPVCPPPPPQGTFSGAGENDKICFERKLFSRISEGVSTVSARAGGEEHLLLLPASSRT